MIVWLWLRKYWQWLFPPIGIAIALIGYIVSKSKKPVVEYVAPDDTLVEDVEEANRKRDTALIDLKHQYEEKLTQISEEQQKELNDLSNKPIEEVVSWFDKL